MNIRTQEDLGEFLDRELAWRKKELSLVKLSLDSSRTEQIPSSVRAGICMLYAHWEGFIRELYT